MKTTTKSLTNGLPAIHPGEFLFEILHELGLTQVTFAQVIGVSPNLIMKDLIPDTFHTTEGNQ